MAEAGTCRLYVQRPMKILMVGMIVLFASIGVLLLTES